jgi:hypothetical protein
LHAQNEQPGNFSQTHDAASLVHVTSLGSDSVPSTLAARFRWCSDLLGRAGTVAHNVEYAILCNTYVDKFKRPLGFPLERGLPTRTVSTAQAGQSRVEQGSMEIGRVARPWSRCKSLRHVPMPIPQHCLTKLQRQQAGLPIIHCHFPPYHCVRCNSL